LLAKGTDAGLKNDVQALKIRCNTLEKTVENLQSACNTLEKTVENLQSTCNTYQGYIEAIRQQMISIQRDRGTLDLSYQGEEFELMQS
jgi:prefoldin subunit 5